MGNKVLIVLLGSIGDVIRGLAVANALKSGALKSGALKSGKNSFEISWVVEPKSAEIVRMCPDVDHVFVFDRKDGVRAFFRTVSALRKERFDIVLDLQRHAKSGLFSFFSAAKRRIGFNRSNTKEFNHLFNTEYIAPWNTTAATTTTQPKRSKLDAYLSFLSPLGIAIPSKPTWRLDEHRLEPKAPGEIGVEIGAEVGKEAWKLVGNAKESGVKRIGIVLASSWESKDWMGNEALCRAILSKRSESVVLIGDGKSGELAKRLAALNPTRITSTVGATSLAGLVTVLRRCAVVVGPDSGPGHLCAALSVPYVGIFGPTDPGITAPAGNLHLSLAAELGCAPCYRRVCPGLGKLCLRLISPQLVMGRISEALGS